MVSYSILLFIMTYKTQKSVALWTYKHEEYCLKNKIPRAAQLLWEWFIKTGKVNIETEPDLKDFNNWIKKNRGKGYCRNTLKSAFNTLVENRVVNLIKKYTWHIVKIVTRPLEYLKPKRKLQKRNIFDSLGRSNTSKYDDVVLQQQHSLIVDNKLLFSKYGIHFNDTSKKVLNRPRKEILLSIVCYQISDRTITIQGNKKVVERGKIRNPEGWIRKCLDGRYWEHSTTYNQILAEYGNTTFIFELFPELEDTQ